VCTEQSVIAAEQSVLFATGPARVAPVTIAALTVAAAVAAAVAAVRQLLSSSCCCHSCCYYSHSYSAAVTAVSYIRQSSAVQCVHANRVKCYCAVHCMHWVLSATVLQQQ
jgi:hypothetical protein